MKVKYLVIVSLILAILTIGAVSASEDVSDDLAVDEGADIEQAPVDEVEIEQAPADEEIVSADDSDLIADGEDDGEDDDELEEGDVVIDIESYVDIDNKDDYIVSIGDYYGVEGTVTVTINGKVCYNRQIPESYGEKWLVVRVSDLNLGSLSYGTYNVKVSYTTEGQTFPEEGNVKLTHVPDVFYAEFISVGEKTGFMINDPKKLSGTITLYNAIDEGDSYSKGSVFATAPITNGFGIVSFAGLSKGDHAFFADVTYGNFNAYNDFGRYMLLEISVLDNDPNYSSTISSTSITDGETVTVTVKGPSGESVAIDIDGKAYKSGTLTAGTYAQIVSGLTVGTHYIGVYSEGADFYSTTYVVTVKAKPAPAPAPAKEVVSLTLKKVKSIKKSAKKLVLSATLKVNGKAKSGVKVTFKLNKKTFTAKTNKKGVAKVTIKKKVLKKLKGKKATIQASYGKTVKKMTVKIKK